MSNKEFVNFYSILFIVMLLFFLIHLFFIFFTPFIFMSLSDIAKQMFLKVNNIDDFFHQK